MCEMKTAYRIAQILSMAMAVIGALDGNWETAVLFALVSLIIGQEIALLRLAEKR